MRVLLISPLPELDPPCGDVTYTETLLAHPPAGVEYVTYAEAMRDGTLKERARRASLHNDRTIEGLALLLREAVVNRARGAGLLFREPFRFFVVAPGAYDLIHCHVFHARIEGHGNTPVIVSSGTPQPELYTDAFRWSRLRVRAASWCDRALARVTGVNHSSLWLRNADRVVCFTEYLRSWLVSRGVAPADRATVVAAGTPRGPRRDADGTPHRVGFVATDFVAKGGDVVLAAYELARAFRPDLELLVIGSSPRLDPEELNRRRIVWLPRVPREELLQRYFPSMDVFAYPTNCDGPSLVLQEALACGVPAAVSNYGAMPDMVQHGRAGLVSSQRDAVVLAENMLRILDPENYPNFEAGANEVFQERYELGGAHEQLRHVYLSAIQARAQRRI